MSKTGSCDFCGKTWNPLDHTWFCHHTEPFEIRDRRDGTIYAYDDEWLVCNDCDNLIATNNHKALALRSAESHPEREPGNLRQIYGMVEFLHGEFRRGWRNSHPLHERRECLTRLPNVH
jgi:hypothetical protein